MGQFCGSSTIFLTGIYINARSMPVGMVYRRNNKQKEIIIIDMKGLLGCRDRLRGVEDHVGLGTADNNILVNDHFSDVFH